jgi:hypothetical protein
MDYNIENELTLHMEEDGWALVDYNIQNESTLHLQEDGQPSGLLLDPKWINFASARGGWALVDYYIQNESTQLLDNRMIWEITCMSNVIYKILNMGKQNFVTILIAFLRTIHISFLVHLMNIQG